jgi:hypothetical protein
VAKAKRAGKSYKAYYSLYKSTNRWSVNRKRRLEKLQKLQPNNAQIPLAIKAMRYRRRTPTSNSWSHQSIYYANLFKQFGAPAPLSMFSTGSNQKHPHGLQLPLAEGKSSDRVSFSLGARAHDGRGNRIWK